MGLRDRSVHEARLGPESVPTISRRASASSSRASRTSSSRSGDRRRPPVETGYRAPVVPVRFREAAFRAKRGPRFRVAAAFLPAAIRFGDFRVVLLRAVVRLRVVAAFLAVRFRVAAAFLPAAIRFGDFRVVLLRAVVLAGGRGLPRRPLPRRRGLPAGGDPLRRFPRGALRAVVRLRVVAAFLAVRFRVAAAFLPAAIRFGDFRVVLLRAVVRLRVVAAFLAALPRRRGLLAGGDALRRPAGRRPRAGRRLRRPRGRGAPLRRGTRPLTTGGAVGAAVASPSSPSGASGDPTPASPAARRARERSARRARMPPAPSAPALRRNRPRALPRASPSLRSGGVTRDLLVLDDGCSTGSSVMEPVPGSRRSKHRSDRPVLSRRPPAARADPERSSRSRSPSRSACRRRRRSGTW